MPQLTLESLSGWIEAEMPAIETTLRDLVHINTYTQSPERVEQGMLYLESLVKHLGFTSERINQKHRLIHSGNHKGPRVMLISHMDTVHAPELDFDHYTPHGDGFVSGAGVGDIKGGLVMGLWAMKAISQMLTDFDLCMVVSADEEQGSPSLCDWLAEPTAHQANYGIGLEPGFPQGPLTPTVNLGVVYQRRGYSAIDFTVQGVSAHSGHPHLGLNAIEALARRIVELHKLNDWEHHIAVNVGLVSGGTSPNTVPGSATANVSFRTMTHEGANQTMQQILDILERPHLIQGELQDRCSYTITTHLPPMEDRAENWKLVNIVLDEAIRLRQPVVAIVRGGGSDVNHFSASGIPCICGMGAPSEDIRTLQEKIYLPVLFERINLLTATVYRLLTEHP